MIQNLQNRKEFSKGTPSCFLVMSAFQLLCALEAIKEFDISDYKIIFVLVSDYGHRNEQMRDMAKQMHVAYDEYNYNQIKIEDFQNRAGLFESKNEIIYERIFVGDYNAISLLLLATKYATNNAVLLFTDDGNASISLFKGINRDNRPQNLRQKLTWYKNTYKVQKKKRKGIYQSLLNSGIQCTNSFFTIYSDINSKRFVLFPNTFQHLATNYQLQSLNPSKYVIIVGAALSAYASQNRIDEGELEAITWKQLSKIKENHVSEEIIYIPHGRDNNINIPKFCEILSIRYLPIDEPIEYYLLKTCFIPTLVCGYNSTALLNIKRLYPSSQVVNWFIDKKYDNSYYNFFISVRKYYEQSGVLTDVIRYPSPPCSERIRMFLLSIYSVFELLMKKLLLTK